MNRDWLWCPACIVFMPLVFFASGAASAQSKPYPVQPHELLRRARQLDSEGAATLLAEGYERFPRSAPLALAYAQSLYHLGRFSEAVDIYRGCHETAGGHGDRLGDQCLLGEATILVYQNRFVEARRILHELVGSSPSERVRDHAQVLFARCVAGLNDPSAAMTLLAAVGESGGPDFIGFVCVEKARVALMLGRLDEAVFQIEKALEVAERAEYHLLKALTLAWGADLAAAGEALERVRIEDLHVFYRRIPRLLGLALAGENDEVLLKEELALRPHDPAGWLIAALGGWRRAEAGWSQYLDDGRKATNSTFLLDPKWGEDIEVAR
jgi:hypothetical protein